jgi:hypothetical protein
VWKECCRDNYFEASTFNSNCVPLSKWTFCEFELITVPLGRCSMVNDAAAFG